jgi:hypothetical protein
MYGRVADTHVSDIVFFSFWNRPVALERDLQRVSFFTPISPRAYYSALTQELSLTYDITHHPLSKCLSTSLASRSDSHPDSNVPFILMSSFNTAEDTDRVIQKYGKSGVARAWRLGVRLICWRGLCWRVSFLGSILI